jgi:hypothetical protein
VRKVPVLGSRLQGFTVGLPRNSRMSVMVTNIRCGSSTAQQEDYVEQDEDCHHHFQGEHAALVELSDHEFVKLAGRC